MVVGGGWSGVVEWWSGGVVEYTVYSIFLKNIGDFSRICHKGVSISAGPFFLGSHVLAPALVNKFTLPKKKAVSSSVQYTRIPRAVFEQELD